MKTSFRKILCLMTSALLFAGCANNTTPPKGGEEKYTPFFESIANEISAGTVSEKSYYTFYESYDSNRFYVDLHYDLHFGLSLKIEEYDLRSFLFYANEGQVSEDHESITFVYSANEKTDLFKKGTYVLKHELVNKNDEFTLIAADKTYSLSLTPKENPHYICRDLLGEFEARENSSPIFTIKIDVGTKEELYPVTINLIEGEKYFRGTNIRNNEETTTFDITGTSDGQYLKITSGASISYNEGRETYTFKIGDNSYSLVKTKDKEEEQTSDSNYFIDNAEKVMFSCRDFEVRLANVAANNSVYLRIKELVQGGNTNIGCWFGVEEDDSIANIQTITNPNNKVFVGHSKYVFKHHKNGSEDVVDLYFDDVLAYSNLTISGVN